MAWAIKYGIAHDTNKGLEPGEIAWLPVPRSVATAYFQKVIHKYAQYHGIDIKTRTAYEQSEVWLTVQLREDRGCGQRLRMG